MSRKKNNLATQESTEEIIVKINQLLKEARRNEKAGIVKEALSLYSGFNFFSAFCGLIFVECSDIINQKSIDVGIQIEKKLSKKIGKLEVSSNLFFNRWLTFQKVISLFEPLKTGFYRYSKTGDYVLDPFGGERYVISAKVFEQLDKPQAASIKLLWNMHKEGQVWNFYFKNKLFQ